MSGNICYPFFRSNIADCWGGSFESTYIMADELKDTYHTSVILSGTGRPYERAKQYDFAVDIIPFDTVRGINMQHWPSLFRKPILGIHLIPYSTSVIDYIKSNDVNIIHANDPVTALLWGACARITDTKLIAHIRGEYISDLKVKIISRLADYLIFVSESGFQHHKQNVQKGLATSVVHNGVDVNRFNPHNEGSLRQELDITPDTHLFGFIGNLVRRKRPLLFIESAIQYLQEHSGHFVLAGNKSSELGKRVQDRISNTVFSNHISLLGFRNDIENITASIDVLVLTSTKSGEAFPRTPLEAMASGAPVVTTDTAGVSEAVADGDSGVVLTSDPEPNDVASALGDLISNPNRLDTYSKNARKHVVQNFSSDIVSSKINEIYKYTALLD